MAKRPVGIEDLELLTFVGDPQISPDGKALLFGHRKIAPKNKYVNQLSVVKIERGKPRQITFGETSASAGRWSPDGKSISFIGKRYDANPQFHLLHEDGGEARQISNLPEGDIGGYRWSPDGKSIAFTFRLTPKERTSAASKEREQNGASTPPLETEDLWYRLDGDGYFGSSRFALYLLDLESGEHRELAKGDSLGSIVFDWAPDGTGLYLVHSASRDPLLSKPNDQVYWVPLKGKKTQFTKAAHLSIGTIKVSPDGATLAFLGDETMEDAWGTRNTSLFVLDLSHVSRKVRRLAADADYCLDTQSISDTGYGGVGDGGGSGLLAWTAKGDAIIVNAADKGEVQIASVDLKSDKLTILTKGKHCVLGGNIVGPAAACTVGTATEMCEAAVCDLRTGKLKKLSAMNHEFNQTVELVKPTEHWVKSDDGTPVHTWVMRPTKPKGKLSPAILEIHGGPHTQYGWAVFHEFQVLCAEGYVVVYSNPRGSKGYGESFCAAIKADWGNKDWQDIQAVANWMSALPGVDPKRTGIMGGSYGGYMTNWAVGKTRQFKAAITDRCVYNLVSMAGTCDFPFNKDGYFGGLAWGPLAGTEGLWRQSPISLFDKVKTPMLIIHSVGDLRCNIEQAEQLFVALKSRGVPARFVRYPVESSHGMSRNGPPDLRAHRLREILAWWKRWLAK